MMAADSFSGRSRRRYRRILRSAAWHLLVIWWFELVLPRFGLARVAARKRTERSLKIARRFRVLALDLQGLMIKMGQFLSSRLDVLPPEVTAELSGLQDEVPPAAQAEVAKLAAVELGMPVDSAFAAFDPTPIAAASLGQAHRAVLTPLIAAEVGFSDVIVKIQRPGIDEIVRVDLAALERIAGWLSHIRLVNKRTDAPALMAEFAATSIEEIDYLHEAANGQRFIANFRQDPRVSAPQIVWERSSRRVLTMSDVGAIKIDDHAALAAAGIDRSTVAAEFARVMLDQLFEHRFFHGDPHPGNVFVTPVAQDANPADWQLTFIDFGMMGEFPEHVRSGLRKVIIAVATRNGKALVDSARELGVLLPDTDTIALEEALTALFARFGGMSVADLQRVDPKEFRDFAAEFSDIVRALPFQLPEDFLLMIRAVSLVSGVCSALDPEFNMWTAVEPYATKLAAEQGRSGLFDGGRQTLESITQLVAVPQRISGILSRAERGELAIRNPKAERRLSAIELSLRKLTSAAIFSALLLAGVLLRDDDPTFGTTLMWLSGLPLAHSIFARSH